MIPRTAAPGDVLRAALDALERGEPVALASVVARHGSAPSTPGQKLALFADGRAVGTVGGGAVEKAVLEAMAQVLGDPTSVPRIDTFRLGPTLGMCCGGQVEVLIEPLAPAMAALVIGAGHVGSQVGPLLAGLGFRVVVCDAREEAVVPARLGDLATIAGPGKPALMHAEFDDPEVAAALPSRLGDTAALVMTHDHQVDQAAIAWALARGFGFVGGVGSRAKAARTRARLLARGVAEADVDRVRMPVGVEIGARTPAEIAVAIAAELVAWRAARASRTVGVEDAANDSTSAEGRTAKTPE